MVRITSASVTETSAPPWPDGTVIPSRPLASNSASSRAGTAAGRSRSITPAAIDAANSRATATASSPELSTGMAAVTASGAVSTSMADLQSACDVTTCPECYPRAE